MKRKIALTLAFTLMFNTSALALNNAYTIATEIAHDTTHYEVYGEGNSSYQRVNYIDYMPNEDTKPIVVYGNNIYGLSTMDNAVTYAESLGYNVMAAFSGDYFVTTTGVSIGLVIREGEIMTSDAWQNAVGFYSDGSAVIGNPAGYMSLTSGSISIPVNYFNKARQAGYTFLFNSNFSDTTKTVNLGKNIIFETVDDSVPKYNSSVPLVVVDIIETTGAIDIADNQYVLSIPSTDDTSILDGVEIGMEFSFNIGGVDSNFYDVDFAVGGKEILIENGAVVSGLDNVTSNPRSAVGIREDGSVVLYEVDGRQSPISGGLTLYELANELYALGCVSAINLDGGATSVIGVKEPGDTSVTTANIPSSYTQRLSANYILLVNTTEEDGSIDKLYVTPESHYLLEGASTSLSAKAIDENYFLQELPSKYYFYADEGDIDDNIYTATKAGEDTVWAKNQLGNYKNETTIYVFDEIDAIEFTNDEGQTVTDINVASKQSFDINIIPTVGNITPTSTDSLFTFSLDSDLGTIDENGLFTSNGILGNGNISVSFGNFTTSIPLSVGLSQMQKAKILADFEYTVPSGYTLNTDISKVNYGVGSGSIVYELDETGIYDIAASYAIDTSYANLGFYLYTDDAPDRFTANFLLADGTVENIDCEIIELESFNAINIQIPDDATYFVGFSVIGNSGTSGTLYIDQIHYTDDSITDETAPDITITSDLSTLVLTAEITDNNSTYVDTENISVLLDGVSLDFSYNTTTGILTATLPEQTTQLSKLEITVSDKVGNIARLISELTQSNISEIIFGDVSTSWAKTYINYAYNAGLLMGSEKDGMLYYYPDDNLTRQEFAVIMARYLNLDTNYEEDYELPFDDADEIDWWARDYVKAVYDAGIIQGSQTMGQLLFNPDDNITRGDVITIIGRTFIKGYEITETNFDDASSIASWTAPYVETLTSLGIINGYSDNTLRPLNYITRNEIAKILFYM